MKVNMKETDYYKSGEQIVNILLAGAKGLETVKRNAQLRSDKYNENPKICKRINCNESLPYEKRNNQFCSKSCGAHHNNSIRDTDITIPKQQATFIKNKQDGLHKIVEGSICKIKYNNCEQCSKSFITRTWKTNKCCSIHCAGQLSFSKRKHTWGKCLSIPYFNREQNCEIILQSNWELAIAKLLDDNKIVWIRPNPIPWLDSNDKSHLYYPDFYIPKYDLYLDPKNDQVIKSDKEKLIAISNKITLKYGSLEYISNIVKSLT